MEMPFALDLKVGYSELGKHGSVMGWCNAGVFPCSEQEIRGWGGGHHWKQYGLYIPIKSILPDCRLENAHFSVL